MTRRILPCAALAALFAAAMPAPAAMPGTVAGTLVLEDGERWRVEDAIAPAASGGQARLQRRVIDADGNVRYESRTALDGAKATWQVTAGHPDQRVTLRITPGLVVALDAQGRERWRGVPDAPVCLPELFPELAAQAEALRQPGDALDCQVPVDKAEKLAPLRLRRLPDGADGSRRYEMGPGSLGMRLFFGRQSITVSADGRSTLAVDGQLEMARRPEGRLRYVEGELRHAAPRPLLPLPAVLRAEPDPAAP